MPYFFIALSNTIGGSTYVATAAALKGFSGSDVMFLRMAICGILFLPFLWCGRQRLRGLSREDLTRIVAVGLFGFALPLTLGTYGLMLSTSTSAALLVGVEPVAIIVLSAIFLGERLTRMKIAALILGLSGALLITFQGIPSLGSMLTLRFKGDAILFLHGLSWALYSVIAKPTLERINPLDFTAASSVIGCLGVCAWTALMAEPGRWGAASVGSWAAVFYLAAAGGFLGTTLWNVALSSVDASRIANFIFIQPIVGVVLGLLWQGDILTPWSVGGGVLVLGGLWAATQ